MSKDWKPYEQFIVDRAIKQERGTSLRDTKIVMKFNGEEKELGNKDAKAEFPELSFLFGDEFYPMYEKHSNNPSVCKVFQTFEDALKDVEGKFIQGGTSQSVDLSNTEYEVFIEQPIETVVTEWFMGRLDASFYYREENDRMLSEYINCKIEEALEKEVPLKDKHKKAKGEERE